MIILGSDGLPVGRRKSNYMNIDGVLHKRCTHCGQYFRLSYFYPLKYRRKGEALETLQSWCKFCMVSECCKKAKEKREKQLNNIDHEETKA